MGFQETSTTRSWEPAISAGNWNPGQSIFSDRQWRSLAGSLHLSGREREIVECLFEDLSEPGMAQRLDMSAHTVHTHLKRMYRKLGVSSRNAAVVRVFAEHVRRRTRRRAAERGMHRSVKPHA